MHTKILRLLACFILPFIEHTYFNKHNSQREFFTLGKVYNKRRVRVFFCGVTLQGCLVQWLCYLLLKLLIWVVLTKIKTLNFYTNTVNFFAIKFWAYCLVFFMKFLKVGLTTTLINRRFCFGLSILTKSIFHSRCNTSKSVISCQDPSLCQCAQATQLFSKCHSSGEPLATLCLISLAKNLNLQPPALETNTLLLDQLDSCFLSC